MFVLLEYLIVAQQPEVLRRSTSPIKKIQQLAQCVGVTMHMQIAYCIMQCASLCSQR